jgi:hypothetical protein
MAKSQGGSYVMDQRTLVEISRMFRSGLDYSQIAQRTGIPASSIRYHFDTSYQKNTRILSYIDEFKDLIVTIGLEEGLSGGIPFNARPGSQNVSISQDNCIARMLIYMDGSDYPIPLKKMAKQYSKDCKKDDVGIYDLKSGIIFAERMGMVTKAEDANVRKYRLTPYGRSLAEIIGNSIVM